MSATSSDGRDTSGLASGGRFGALLELARNAIERAHDLADGLGGDTRNHLAELLSLDLVHAITRTPISGLTLEAGRDGASKFADAQFFNDIGAAPTFPSCK